MESIYSHSNADKIEMEVTVRWNLSEIYKDEDFRCICYTLITFHTFTVDNWSTKKNP